MHCDDLIQNYANSLAYLRAEAAIPTTDPKAVVSELWKDILSERATVFPTLSEIQVFRRSTASSGIGEQLPPELQRENFESAVKLARASVDWGRVSAMKEPEFGAPHIYEFGGYCGSEVFALNLITFSRVVEVIEAHLNERPTLRILEIGSGFGVLSNLLHQKFGSRLRYAICDIPDNLFLSSIYLPQTLNMNARFVRNGQRVKELESGTITYTVPQNLDQLDTQFDLVINTFSMQEMTAGAVHGYFRSIERLLSDGGIFYSVNSHDKSGIKSPSDYEYYRFEMLSFRGFRAGPPSYFNTIPYEVVLRKAQGPAPHPWSTDRVREFNTLGQLLQLGLSDQLAEIMRAHVEGKLTEEQSSFIREFTGFAWAAQYKSPSLRTMALYLSGLKAFSENHWPQARTLLTQTLEGDLTGFAAARAALLVALIDRQTQGDSDASRIQLTSVVQAHAPYLEREIERLYAETGQIYRQQEDVCLKMGRPYKYPLSMRVRLKGAQLRRRMHIRAGS